MNIPENTTPTIDALATVKPSDRKEPPLSPSAQSCLLSPLLAAIRAHLAATEYAAFRRTTHGSPYIEARTERDVMIASITEDGLYALDAGGSRYDCDHNASQDVINNTIRRALNDAREAWS